MLLFTILAFVASIVITVALLGIVMLLLIFLPTVSFTVMMGISVWGEHGFIAGILAAVVTCVIFSFVASHKKTHLTFTAFISLFMCSCAFAMVSVMVPALAPDGWMIIPVILLSLVSTYITVVASEENYVADKYPLVVDLLSAVFCGLTANTIVMAMCGGLSNNDVSAVLQWGSFAAGAVIAFFILRKSGNFQLRIPILDHFAKQLRAKLEKE